MTATKTKVEEKILVPVPLDGGWGWMVVLGTFFIHVFSDGFIYSLGVLGDVFIKEFNSDNTAISLILSLLVGFSLGSGPFASAVCNKFGCRITAILGSIIAAAGAGASYYATELWHLVVSVGIVMGVGFCFMYCPAIVAVTMYFEKKRAMATGIAVTGAGVGTVLFSPINDYVISHHGWRAIFGLFTGILVFSTACGATFKPLKLKEVFTVEGSDGTAVDNCIGEVKVSSSEVFSSEKSGLPNNSIANKFARFVRSFSDAGPTATVLLPTERRRCTSVGEKSFDYSSKKDVYHRRTIVSAKEFAKDANKSRVMSNMLAVSLHADPAFLIFALSNLLTSIGFNSPLYFLPLYAVKDIELDSATASHILSVYGFFNIMGRIAFGFVADRKLPLPFGLGENINRNRLYMYTISLMLCGLATMLSFLCRTALTLSVYSGLFGFLIAGYICLTTVVLVDLFGLEKLTSAFGLLLLWQGIGTIAGPPISGYIADKTHSYTGSFAFCGLNLLVSGAVIFIIPYIGERDKQSKLEDYQHEVC